MMCTSGELLPQGTHTHGKHSCALLLPLLLGLQACGWLSARPAPACPLDRRECGLP